MGVAFDNEEALAEVAEKLDVEFVPSEYGEPVRVLLGGQDVTNDIRTETVGNDASKIAPLASVRAALLQRQRNFAVEPGLVADGRDMGTVVFPEAEYKVFMTASAEARADRRFKQLKAEGEDVKIAPLLKEIEERDARDMGRKNAPLKAAEDAYHVDTTGLSIEEVLKEVVNFIERKS
ncbi:hypothetical protein A3740_20955 [Oleiphilus sp. HI0068]|nr:hypothetical protein A3740_20955 [Oleiphilus sp. HI0068]